MRRLRPALPWLLLALVALAAVAVRYGLIEASVLGHRCEAAPGTPLCAVRQALVLDFLGYGYGYAALAASALALLWRRLPVAWLAAALGVLALLLYCVEAGAFALLVGCLRLLRCQAAAQHGNGQGEVQAQP